MDSCPMVIKFNDKDQCKNDMSKMDLKICRCGMLDLDMDGHGTPNSNNHCKDDKDNIVPGICGCRMSDADADQDGMALQG